MKCKYVQYFDKKNVFLSFYRNKWPKCSTPFIYIQQSLVRKWKQRKEERQETKTQFERVLIQLGNRSEKENDELKSVILYKQFLLSKN